MTAAVHEAVAAAEKATAAVREITLHYVATNNTDVSDFQFVSCPKNNFIGQFVSLICSPLIGYYGCFTGQYWVHYDQAIMNALHKYCENNRQNESIAWI